MQRSISLQYYAVHINDQVSVDGVEQLWAKDFAQSLYTMNVWKE